MRLISWNVNGLRACLTKGFADYFADINAIKSSFLTLLVHMIIILGVYKT